MKITIRRIIFKIALIIGLLTTLLLCMSYILSKTASNRLVGKTIEYFPLSNTQLTIEPFSRNRIVWKFKYSYPNAFDEEFYIYTSLFSDIELTNPRDIEERLREMEKLGMHPYSPEAIEKRKQQQIKKKQIAQKKGTRLFEASPFKNSFKEHFTLSNIEAEEDGKIYGVYFKEPEWRATLSPKKSYLLPFQVMAVFPINNNSEIEVSITPDEIENALDRCLSHPYVLKHIERSATTGIRLRITGDRLHWDTPELQELLTKLKGGEIKENQLKEWAHIIIDSEDHPLFSFYLNSISGELIYSDTTANCSEPILVLDETNETKQTQ